MRLIAGEAKGRRLQVPRGRRVRPTGARLRESAFGILEHRGAISGARVLDLFAGTGALGLEALSRGADQLIAVEQDRFVARVLAANASACGFADRVEVRCQPVEVALERLAGRGRFGLVLLDPPYRSREIVTVLRDLVRHGLLEEDAFVLAEHAPGAGPEVHPGYALETVRRHGDTALTLLRHTSAYVERKGASARVSD
jgi:16S rRNA (guanine(966)-N(2))-methyltransferase RsmD